MSQSVTEGFNVKGRIKEWIIDSGVRFSILQELRHELHLIGLRLRKRFDPRHRRTARRLYAQSEVMLHFGCGSRILPGWVNLDAYHCEGISLELDLQGDLPFGNGSVRWLFTEHVLEHIDRSVIGKVFSEFHRVLAIGGVARILVPDLKFYCTKYLDGDVETITTPLPDMHTTADAVNSVFNDHFHRFIYDFDTMKIELEKAGFSDIVCSKYGESRHREVMMDSNTKSRRIGTLCVEATRTGE